MAHWQGLSDCPAWWDLLASQSGRLAFDIGANGGTVTAMFAKNFDQVIALEPAKESYEDLAKHAASNVVALPIACGQSDGTIRLDVRERSIRSGQLVAAGAMAHVGWGDVEGTRQVPSVTVDTLAEKYGRPDVVKIDVEGGELQVLQGAGITLAEKQTVWLIEVHSAALGEQLLPYLEGYDVETWRHSGYRPESRWRNEHFYLRVTP